MALQTFKEVIQNKGYRISSKDRQIFEKENLQSFFGLSDSDVIEFVVYDSNDNQLPQASYGLVRYIKLSTENIKDYILIPTGTVFQKYKFPKEYFIDVERLLKEAGYTNGIFKTQVTLLNKRVGSGDEVNNKLWISEISPSRTEIRLYPLKKGLEEYSDLQQRFNIFTNNKNFKEDTIYNISSFLENIKADYITELIKNKYTAKWFDTLRSEFKISNFDEFATKIKNSFTKSSEYEFSNRFSKIDELNYGQVKPTKQNLDLSVSDIKETCKRILVETINHYLSYPDAKTAATFDSGINVSNDYVTSVLQRNETDTLIDTNFPVLRQTTILKGPVSALDLSVQQEDPSKNTSAPSTVINETLVIGQPSISTNRNDTLSATTNNPLASSNKKPFIDGLQIDNQFGNEPKYDAASGLLNFGEMSPTIVKANPTKFPILVIDNGTTFSNTNTGGTTTGATTGGTTTGGTTTGGTTGRTNVSTTTPLTNPTVGISIPGIQLGVGSGIDLSGISSIPNIATSNPAQNQPVTANPPYDYKPVISTPNDIIEGGNGGANTGDGLSGADGYFGS